ncbi:MAG TPA: polysaccharide deacetylase family protein [Polyangiaceae bacterium]|nr:polysaccharide deacetylase family protein [Polyangiaceae bacterium]
MRVCAISVDLDEIHHYHAIHGLAAPGPAAAHQVYGCALSRFRDFAAAERIPLTLFAVGADLERAENGRGLRELAERGHEIANHSFDHWYDLSRRPRDEMRQQVERASAAISAQTGVRPSGFRAPGYVMSDGLYGALAELGVSYSSSVFPCPYYYFAKLAKLGALWLRGRASESIAAGAEMLLAPRAPYRVGQPYWRAGSGLLELPIQVTPHARWPVFGTSLMLLGPRGARKLVRSLAQQELVNLELHGIDLLDADDRLSELAPHQFDLRIPLERKWQTLSAVVDELRALGFSFQRLDEVARGVR